MTDRDRTDLLDEHAMLPRAPGFGVSRRRALQLLAGAGVAGLAAACGSNRRSTTAASSEPSTTSSPSTTGGSPTSGASTPSTTSSTTATPPTSAIPTETAGPYPADGSNGPNVLGDGGIVRSDIRSSYGAYAGTAPGVPLAITLTVLDLANGAAPRPGAAIYLWHCDRDGRYSLYTASGQNYLRGVQVTDAKGQVTFTTAFPGCYPGRWPHVHFEVYESLDAARSAGAKLTTSQLALPQSVCETVYRTTGYEASAANLGQISLATDMVFADGWSLEMASIDGSVASGLRAALRVPV